MPRRKGTFAKLVKPKAGVGTDKRRWYVRYPHPDKIGEIKQKSFRTETEAVDYRDSLNALHETERKVLKYQQWTVGTVLDFWVEKKASHLASSVKEKPRAEYIKGVLGGVTIADLDEEHYEKLHRHIKADKTRRVKTDRGFDAYFVTLRTALNYAKKKNKIATFPAFDEFITDDYEPRERVLSDDEFDELIKACHVVKGGRDRAHLATILVWLHETACRSGELKTIRVGDIDIEQGIVRIRQSKRKLGRPTDKRQSKPKAKYRDCGLSPRLQQMILESNLLDFDDNDFVIGKPLGMPNTGYDFKRAFATACRIAKDERIKNGLKGDCFDGLNIHDLRHTGITKMLQSGMSLPAVGSMVGHEPKSLMTLEVYTKFQPHFLAQEMQKRGA